MMVYFSPLIISMINTDATLDTVVTSFPQQWDNHTEIQNTFHGVLESIQSELKNPHRPALQSVSDLASLIINNCSGVFDPFRVPSNQQYLDLFDNSICDIVITGPPQILFRRSKADYSVVEHGTKVIRQI